MERLESMKEALISCVESQIHGHLKEVDTKELGEAVDMIKDLSEAIYYCTITEAMEGKDYSEEPEPHGTMYYNQRVLPMYNYPMEYYGPKGKERYMDGNTMAPSRGMKGPHDKMIRMPYDDMPYEDTHDPREGRSGMRRKMYMENKNSKDKTKQMQELEAYMQELSTDLTEMIQDASPEEKQMLQQKISVLATKIK